MIYYRHRVFVKHIFIFYYSHTLLLIYEYMICIILYRTVLIKSYTFRLQTPHGRIPFLWKSCIYRRHNRYQNSTINGGRRRAEENVTWRKRRTPVHWAWSTWEACSWCLWEAWWLVCCWRAASSCSRQRRMLDSTR